MNFGICRFLLCRGILTKIYVLLIRIVLNGLISKEKNLVDCFKFFNRFFF